MDHDDNQIARNSQDLSDIEIPPEKQIKLIDEAVATMNEYAGITTDQSKQNLLNSEADFGTEKNKESPFKRSSEESEDDYLNETLTKQEMEVLMKSQGGQLPNNSKRMDEQDEKINRPAGITSDRSKQNLLNSEADFGTEKNKESPSERSSEESEDGYLNETSTKQEMEVLIDSQEGQLPNNRKRRLDDTQVKHIEPTEFGRDPIDETSEGNVLIDQSSTRRVEQAMESLKLLENFQEEKQYEDALSCCQSALQLLDLSQDTNLYMKFCYNIMQLYFLMENIEAANSYYDLCVDVLKSTSDIDPKVIQSMVDLHTLCMKKLKGDEE